MYDVLITGSNGFVGTSLKTFLISNGLSIQEVRRNPEKNSFERDANTFDAKTWIHLAGKAHDLKGQSSLSEYIASNKDLTIELFKLFLSSQTARTFIFFSSVKAIADSTITVLKEEDENLVESPYGISKKLAEEALVSLNISSNKRLIILRPCMIHGPGNKGNLNLLYNFVKKGIPYPLGAFENQRSFLSIENLNASVLTMINRSDFQGGIYHVADDHPLSTNELVSIIGETLKKPVRIWKISTSFVKIMARIGTLFMLPINNHRLKKLTESYVVSNAKLKAALGWSKMPVDTREGLIRTIKSFKS